MVKDGTVTALLKGVKLEAHGGEEHSEEVAAQLAEALKEKARVRITHHNLALFLVLSWFVKLEGQRRGGGPREGCLWNGSGG